MNIAHLGDIHIKNYSRIEEYEYLLDSLCNILKNSKVKVDRIVVAGDIFHSKTILSGYSITFAVKLFTRLSAIADVDCIDGNHDVNLTNKDRMSSLEAVAKIMKGNNKFHYYKDSGIYSIGDNHYYGVFSILDTPDKYPIEIENKIPEATYIALYHGALFGNINEDGFQIHSNTNPNELFYNYDYTFLADIHKRQFLSNSFIIEREIDAEEIEKYKHELDFKIIE